MTVFGLARGVVHLAPCALNQYGDLKVNRPNLRWNSWNRWLQTESPVMEVATKISSHSRSFGQRASLTRRTQSNVKWWNRRHYKIDGAGTNKPSYSQTGGRQNNPDTKLELEIPRLIYIAYLQPLLIYSNYIVY